VSVVRETAGLRKWSAFSGAKSLRGDRRPRVSVVVPCFNYGHWLGDCFNSVLTQPHVDVELVVVNDASLDSSGEVIRQFASADSRIKIIEHRENVGHIPSINEALDYIGGDYVVKLDADDMLSPGCLSRAVALLEAYPSVGFVYGRPLHFGVDVSSNMSWSHRLLRRYTYVRSENPTSKRIDCDVRSWRVWSGDEWIARLCARGGNCISQPEVVMRASKVKAVGSYDVGLSHTSDLAMWLELASISDVAWLHGPIQGFYRVHSNSMQRTTNSGKLRDWRGRVAAFERVLRKSTNGVARAAELLFTAKKRIAAEAIDSASRAYDRGRVCREPIDDYIALALEIFPAARSLPEWSSFQRRVSMGSRWCPFWPPFFARAVMRRAWEEVSALRWWQSGV
jgi:glycosyltransferase involved in cell wall biosynthesis